MRRGTAKCGENTRVAGGYRVRDIDAKRSDINPLVSDESQKTSDKYKVIFHHISCSFRWKSDEAITVECDEEKIFLSAEYHETRCHLIPRQNTTKHQHALNKAVLDDGQSSKRSGVRVRTRRT